MEIKLNGINTVIPVKTMKVIDAIDTLIEVEKQYQQGLVKGRVHATATYNFFKFIVGEPKAALLLDGDDIESIDISKLVGYTVQILLVYSKTSQNAPEKK